MNRSLKLAVLSVAAAATALTPLAEANAGQSYRQHEMRQRSDAGDAIIAGILGLAIGAIAAGVIASDNSDNDVEPVNPYRHPRPSIDREYLMFGDLAEPEGEPEDVVYVNEYEPSFEPWSRDWYRWCSREHSSFDANTGTFVGYDGVERFCVAY